MNENSGNNLIPRAFPWNPLGRILLAVTTIYRYFLFGLKMTITGLLTIIVILRSLTHTPTHTLALALTLTLTLQEDIIFSLRVRVSLSVSKANSFLLS